MAEADLLEAQARVNALSAAHDTVMKLLRRGLGCWPHTLRLKKREPASWPVAVCERSENRGCGVYKTIEHKHKENAGTF